MSDSDGNGGWGGTDAVGVEQDASGDSVTETTHKSWFQRLLGSLVAALIGLAMVPGASVLLFWNEGRAVQTARSLAEGAAGVTAADAGRIDPAMEGRLIHVAGPLAVAKPPADRDFGLQSGPGTTRLVRRVEMFQWREDSQSERRTNLGGSQDTVTTYSYRQVWAADRIDSGRFRQQSGHQNPTPRYAGTTQTAPEAMLGARRISAAQLAGIGEARPLPLDQAMLTLPAGARIVGDAIYVGADPERPRIGDLRIRFEAAAPASASIVAAQAGDGFAPFATRAGDRLLLTAAGQVPAAEMFHDAEASNTVLTWILRAVGAVLMLVGFCLLWSPLSTLVSVIPFLETVAGAGAFLVGLVLTLVLAPTVIAVAWFFYRPLVAAGVLAVGLAGAFAVSRLGASRKAARPAAMRAAAPGPAAAAPAPGRRPWDR
ncbi:TMEM43 family protein [Falsiroseomonas sp. HW251]|uniref:TMEM43 family protein n=1 Tax=Falsiroseomonas sp. HW251 TaxID=3390998 RepID=UPI003D31447D